MAKRYDPVLGRWIYGLPDDAPEFGPPNDEPITLHFDGSWKDVGFLVDDGVTFTTVDESHEFTSKYFASPQGRVYTGRVYTATTAPGWIDDSNFQRRCAICWADPGECTHTGWDGVDDEGPIRIPPAERAGPAMIGDGVLRATVSGLSWMAVKKKLAAVDDVLLQLAKLHAPSLEEDSRGRLVRPECQECRDTSGCREEWPCQSATILLRRVGLTERDLDYQLGDERDGEAEGGL